jgi:hypothetical protein
MYHRSLYRLIELGLDEELNELILVDEILCVLAY